jgi:hypothetical protein
MKKILVTLAIATIVAGCSTQVALINGSDGRLAKEEMQTFFVNGLAQTQTIDAAAICGGAEKVVKVERTTSFINGLLSSISQGIYTPYDAKVYCK